MKPINVQVKVEINKNWAGEKYAIFSTEKHGAIAELDWPSERGRARVYPLKQNEIDGDATNYITFSSVPQGIIGAETATKTYLMGLGYYVNKIVYPKEMMELRRQAFKTDKK